MIEARVECGVEQRFGVLLLVKNAPLPCNGGTSRGGVSTHYFPDNIYTCLRTIEFLPTKIGYRLTMGLDMHTLGHPASLLFTYIILSYLTGSHLLT
jgi:hypothetical protein